MNNINKENTTALAAVYNEVPTGYIGIYTIDDIYAVRNNLSGKYILMNDIDMSETASGGDWDSGNGWLPIDNFEGTFDGNGYAIKNMHIYGDWSGGKACRLFGTIKYASICKVALIDCDINLNTISSESTLTSNHSYNPEGIGSLVGKRDGYVNSATIDKCYVTGNIKVTISNDKAYYESIGGICRKFTDQETDEITNSYNATSITVVANENMTGAVYIGGIAGESGRGISNVYNVGKIGFEDKRTSSEKTYIGNISGKNSWATDSYYLRTRINRLEKTKKV